MKKICAVLLAGIMLVSIWGCGGNEALKEPDNGNMKIGLSMNLINTSQQEWLDFFLAAAESQGIQVEYTNADADMNKQIDDIESLIALECDAIIVRAVDPDGILPAIQQCEDAGIPVIASDYPVNEEAKTAGVLSVSQYEAGAVQGKWLAEMLETTPDLKLQVGYLWGSMTMQDAQDRYNGVMEQLKSYVEEGRVTILDEQLANFKSDDATTVVDSWVLKHEEMNCIIAQNDEMANGAIQALKAANEDADQWYVLGINGTAIGVQNIADGWCRATVYTANQVIAEKALEMAVGAAKGETFGAVDISDQALLKIDGDNYGDYQ